MEFARKLQIDLIKYPLRTEKSTKLIAQKQYSFAVSVRATKKSIKAAIQELFGVDVISVNTCFKKRKKRRVGKFIGKNTQYKRGIVKVGVDNSIDLFENL